MRHGSAVAAVAEAQVLPAWTPRIISAMPGFTARQILLLLWVTEEVTDWLLAGERGFSRTDSESCLGFFM